MSEFEMMLMQSESVDQLAAALSEFQFGLEGAKKDSQNTFLKNKYADLESCIESIKEPLHANGLAVVQTTRLGDNISILVTTLMHKSGQWIKGELPILCAKERDAQAQGSAITYARRYALSAITGLYQTDDDGEGSQNRDKKPAAQSKPQQQQRPQQQQSKPQPQQSKPQQQQASKNIVEGEEPTDTEIVKQPDPVQQAKNQPPTGEVFEQILQTGIAKGYSQEDVDDYMTQYLTGNGVDMTSEDMDKIAAQLTWDQVTDCINHFLKPKA